MNSDLIVQQLGNLGVPQRFTHAPLQLALLLRLSFLGRWLSRLKLGRKSPSALLYAGVTTRLEHLPITIELKIVEVLDDKGSVGDYGVEEGTQWNA